MRIRIAHLTTTRLALAALLLATVGVCTDADAKPRRKASTENKLEAAKERARKRADRETTKARKAQERCEVALYEACVLRTGEDNSPCEAVSDGGAVDYTVCSASGETPDPASYTEREFLNVCIYERTGPTGGVKVAEAARLCATELEKLAAKH